jgi:ribosome-associated translation inhibitor RaiA
MDNKETEVINLGNSIQLSGFRDLDGGKMVVLKKLVGNHVRKIAESSSNFEKIELVMKQIGPESSDQYEIHGKLIDNGKVVAAEETDRNMFVVVDKVLTKILKEVSK